MYKNKGINGELKLINLVLLNDMVGNDTETESEHFHFYSLLSIGYLFTW